MADPCDDNFDGVVLLLHCDGVDGSDTFVDSSSYNHAMDTATIISAANPKFGSGSMENGDTSVPYASEFDLSTGDWTLEAWVYASSISGAFRGIFTRINNDFPQNEPYRLFLDTAKLAFSCTDALGAGAVTIVDSIALATDQWVHVAACRSGNNFYLWKDGVQVGTTQVFAGSLGENTKPISIGRMGGAVWSGYIDEARMTKGVARYIAPFTPPTDPFADIACPTEAAVPDVVGELLLYAVEDITGAGFVEGTVQYTPSFDVPVGAVISQTPAGGVSALTGSAVNLVVSLGVPSTSSYATLTDDEAAFFLEIGTKLKFKEAVSAPPLGDDGRSKNMILGRYNQIPGTTRRRGILYGDFLLEDEVITGVYDVTVTPLTDPPFEVTSVLIDPKGKKIGYYSGGGVDGTNYNVAFAVKTNANQTREDTVVFSVQMDVEEDSNG